MDRITDQRRSIGGFVKQERVFKANSPKARFVLATGVALQLLCCAADPAAATVSLNCDGHPYAIAIELGISSPLILGVFVSRDGAPMTAFSERLQIRSSTIDFDRKEARVIGALPSRPHLTVTLSVTDSDGTLVLKGTHKLVCDWNSIG